MADPLNVTIRAPGLFFTINVREAEDNELLECACADAQRRVKRECQRYLPHLSKSESGDE